MAMNDVRDQAVQNTGQWLIGWLAGRTAGLHWGSTGQGMVAGSQPGQEPAGPPQGGGLMRMLGGDSSFVIGCAVDPTLSCDLFYLSFGLQT